MDTTGRLLTVVEVAALLGIGRTKVYELMATGQLAYVAIGRRGRRIEPAAVRAFVAGARTGPADRPEVA